jgi:hypothetical protein
VTRKMLLLASLILPAACATPGRVQSDPCSAWRAILVSRDDVLTRGTSQQLLVHNSTGARLCGWKGPTP